jgi:hypothetical protein
MKYAIAMGLGVMIYIPSFIQIGSAIRKFMGGGGTQTYRQRGDQNKENRVKMHFIHGTNNYLFSCAAGLINVKTISQHI